MRSRSNTSCPTIGVTIRRFAPLVRRDVRLKDETWGHLSCRETQQRPKEKNDEEVND